MIESKGQMWFAAYVATLAAGASTLGAEKWADEALYAYEKRWPVEQSTSVVVAGLDSGMILRAVSQLEAERRVDSALILKSLYEALREAQASGTRLVAWTPPPREGQVLPPRAK